MVITRIRTSKKKGILIFLFILLVTGSAILYYIFTDRFRDTVSVRSDYTINALDLIKEFRHNKELANRKYTEKTITINGRVTEVEQADTTANIKFTDSTSGDYIICAFQEQHLSEAKTLKPGQYVSIKGSCSGGVYSNILELNLISFKRCGLVN